MAQEEVAGVVTRITCERPNWCAGRLRSQGRDVSFSVRGLCQPGDAVTLFGQWEESEKWGPQFKARSLMKSMPVDREGLRKWLAWKFTGIGPITAEKLVNKYDIGLMDQCGSDPESVADFAKLPVSVVEEMFAFWKREQGHVTTLLWLAGHGLSQKQCDNVYAKFGGSSSQTLTEDPFQLLEVEGFGWVLSDAVAAKLGITGDDPRRRRGALAAVVREAFDAGSTCVNVEVACRSAANKIGTRSPQGITDVVDEVVAKGILKRLGGGTDATDFLATPWAVVCESKAWKTFLRAKEPNPFVDPNKADEIAEKYRTLSGMTFDGHQVAAIKNALRYRISVITGGAGAGKTQISRAIIRAFQDDDVQVYLAAPTGKAARRMAEVIGVDASTLHRLLEFNGGTRQFMRNELDPFTNCVILVDEASMCDAEIIFRLFSALGPRTAVVLVGDPNQLPPVGPGYTLRDLLVHDLAPTTRLEKCHRQAGPLKANSVAILSGIVEPTVTDIEPSPWMKHPGVVDGKTASNALVKLYSELLPKWGFKELEHWQVITAKHKGPFGTERLNLILQYLHQKKLGNAAVSAPAEVDAEKPPTLYVGDKVIQTRNNYTLNVMNGEIGTIRGINLTYDQVLRAMGTITGDAPITSDLLAPITEGGDGPRTTLCPVCLTVGAIPDGSGWVPIRCSSCGIDFVASDGSGPPLEREEEHDDWGMGERRIAKAGVVADFVIEFPGNRRVVYPTGMGDDVKLAYCLSCHKVQGSQFPCAIVFVPKSHRFMQTRSWLYTAVTRAQKMCLILGDPDGIREAAEKIVVDDRVTLLDLFARCEEARP